MSAKVGHRDDAAIAADAGAANCANNAVTVAACAATATERLGKDTDGIVANCRDCPMVEHANSAASAGWAAAATAGEYIAVPTISAAATPALREDAVGLVARGGDVDMVDHGNITTDATRTTLLGRKGTVSIAALATIAATTDDRNARQPLTGQPTG